MYKTIRFFGICFLFILFPAMGFSQTIDVQLPYYAGRDYYFCLLEGTKQDTIATGELNARGKATIILPKDYRGVGRFSVKEYGKIWNVVISGNEDIRMIEAPSDSPEGGELEAKTVFEGSPENTFLLNSIARQSRIIQEYYEAASQAESGAQSPSFVLASPEQRMQNIGHIYKAFRGEISDSPLYAARLFEILGCLSGVGSSFNYSENDILAGQRQFVVHKVDFDDLYTSGFWQMAFDVWYQATSVIGQDNDSLLVSDSKRMLDRCDNIPIRREVTQTIIRLFSKYGKDNLLMELGTEYLTMPLNGQLAPQIVTGDGTSFLPKSSLIVFYETGCGNCHYELEGLKNKYKTLTNNNIKVISIAADTGKEVFEETAANLPWADKLCDFKGFDGDNFRHYGIVGTPTYILTDSEGIVRGRYAQLKELLK